MRVTAAGLFLIQRTVVSKIFQGKHQIPLQTFLLLGKQTMHIFCLSIQQVCAQINVLQNKLLKKIVSTQPIW